jgi:predicted PhzF superfamily epimerase YddE/YHI9
VAGAKLIVALGHTDCGVVKGAIDNVDLGVLTAVLANIRPSMLKIVKADTFTREVEGQLFGEMRQVDPVFGKIHDGATVANLPGVKLTDLSDAAPIQTVSTGLPFAVVPLNSLDVLKALRPRQSEIQAVRPLFRPQHPQLRNTRCA